ncbi:carbon-nitrogen hydrolase family protein [Nocardia terpenica]|uniref:Hydrolase n=1 Tax=Nocardia terpenica TaxID=455432 RepID=A0A6G9ZAE3_9NOCA|nr:hydrolase [Nocardia terpenica]
MQPQQPSVRSVSTSGSGSSAVPSDPPATATAPGATSGDSGATGGAEAAVISYSTTFEAGGPLAGEVAALEAEAVVDPAVAAAANRSVDLAVVQFAPHTDKSANLAMLREHVRAAAEHGARVVIAPEYSMFGVSRLDQRAVAAAEPLTGPFVGELRGLAAEFGVHLVAGVVEAPGGAETGRVYNTLVVTDPDAQLVAVYRKVHLYDAFGGGESAVLLPGPIEEPATFTVGDVTFGLQTCFDVRFPEGCRRVAVAGAHVLVVPAQWIPGPLKVEQWRTLLHARAIENTVYVAAADHAAPRGAGTSTIVDPAGSVLAELGDQTGIATARVDLDHLDQIRSTNPSLSLRRFTIEPK